MKQKERTQPHLTIKQIKTKKQAAELVTMNDKTRALLVVIGTIADVIDAYGEIYADKEGNISKNNTPYWETIEFLSKAIESIEKSISANIDNAIFSKDKTF
jgi:hypothetical protein